jgi:hypothetical protein
MTTGGAVGTVRAVGEVAGESAGVGAPSGYLPYLLGQGPLG